MLASPARAQSADAAAAEVLFREGRAAMEAGDAKTACPKFRESNRLDPAPGTVLNLADCEEKLGRFATAWSLFKEVTQRLPASDERHGLAAQRATALEPKVPKLSVKLEPGSPEGTRVLRDGVELRGASLDTLLPVDPGRHEIVVTTPGYADATVAVVLDAGDKKVVRVRPGPKQAGGEASVSSSGSPRTMGWVLTGVGAVGVGVGAVTGVMVLGKKSTVDENCDAQKRCNQTGLDAADSGRTLGTVSGISFIVGGVALAGGAYFLLSGSEKAPGTALAVGPGTVAVRGAF